jgi:hypothetical protein
MGVRRIGWAAGRAVFGALWLLLAGWGALAWYYAGPGNEAARLAPAVLLALIGLAGVLGPAGWRRRARWIFGAAFALPALWWQGLQPSNDRAWQPEVAVLPWAEINGDRVLVHNVRNFNYRSESDFDVAYYDKTYDLSRLNSVDLAAVYWAGPHIAHVIVSFGFDTGDQLAFSIETRKEKGESYSTLAGFFRQYELIYIAADERDVIRLRTNYRKDPPEEVYLYRVQGPVENGRRLFLEYVNKINSLKKKPEWYNTLTTNCTTNVWMHSWANPGHLAFSWKLLASGHVPEYLHESGRLFTGLPFEELRARSRVNDRAQQAGQAPDFARRIRAGLPGVAVP